MIHVKHFRYKNLHFWAEDGLVHMIDERFPPEHTKSYEMITVRDTLKRLREFNAQDQSSMYPGERREWQNYIDDMVHCCRDARKQGDPHTPGVIQRRVHEQKRKWLYVAENGSYRPQVV